MKKLTILLGIFLTTQFASAFGQTPTTTIKYISVYSNATIIQVENTHGNEDGCSFSRATEFLLLPTAVDGSDGSKVLFSALLSAQASGAKVVLGYSGCSQNFPTMNRLDFMK